jgi:tRNA(Ile)-lysidine synthase
MTLEQLADSLPPLQGHLLAGLSGGADSVALCRCLLILRERSTVTVSAVHVNHALRGCASDEDETFVRDFCRKYDIPLMVYRLTPPPHPGEGWAREARYDAFRKAMEACRADALVLAHHRDDQAETVLMHLMRGAGLDGLCGMRQESAVNDMKILRPLLNIPSDDLREALRTCGQAWREDATNAEDAYLRNRVRHQLLPFIETLAPGASEHAAQTAALLAADSDALNTLAQQAMPSHGKAYLALSSFENVLPAIRTRMLRLWWQETQGSVLDAAHTTALVSLLEAPVGIRCTLLQGVTGYRGYTHLHLMKKQKKPKSVLLSGMGEYVLGEITLTLRPDAAKPGNGKTCQALPLELLQGTNLRTRQEGDFIRPFGQQGRQSLQDYLVNHKVDAPFRDQLPLLCKGQEVLLACGVGAGHLPRWQEHFTEAVWSGEIPWLIHTKVVKGEEQHGTGC